MKAIVARLAPVLSILLVVGCGPSGEDAPDELRDAPGFRERVFYLEAPCTITVEGVGDVDIEEEYVPGVVACENGSAPPEALRAQAVQARTFLYYKMFVTGATTISNSTSDQVFSCSYRPNGPGPEHHAAAESTRGQYLRWDGSIIASFYVAAGIPPGPDPNDPIGSCRGTNGNDPTGTENLVTYNWGKSGCDIEMSSQGWTPADCTRNPHNRGTASQNGESCLADVGWEYQQMFPYYYGDDIELVVATGQCGGDDFTQNDRFCLENLSGGHCLDADTFVECDGGRAVTTRGCDGGCSDGVCMDVAPTFCTGNDDGAYCDGDTRVECAGGMPSQTEVCDGGCSGGACQAGNNGTNNGAGNNGAGNNGTNNGVGTEGTNGGDNPGGAVEAVPPYIGRSPGLEGGCATSGGRAAGMPICLLAFALMLMGAVGRDTDRTQIR